MQDSCLDVLVVGGGLSGLATARALLQAAPGLHVAVSEARLRVGGRTLSEAIGGDALDLGGSWIGPKQPLVLGLAEELGLQLVKQPWFEHEGVMGSSGSCASSTSNNGEASNSGADVGSGACAACCTSTATSCAATPTHHHQQLQQHQQQQGQHQQPAQPSMSSGSSCSLPSDQAAELTALMQRLDDMAATLSGATHWTAGPNAEVWDSISAMDWLRANTVHDGVLRELVLLVQTVLSAEPDEVSFLYFLYYIVSSGGVAQLADGEGGAQTWRVKGGSQQFSTGLARHVKALGGSILLGAIVRRVETQAGCGWGEDGAGASGAEGGTSAPGVWLGEQASGAPSLTGSRPEAYNSTSRSQGDSSRVSGASNGSRGGSRSVHGNGSFLSVHLEGGRQLRARHVVLALPPPVWSSVIRFDPPLPEAKRKLGQRMFMGCAAKCIMLFQYAFWQVKTRQQQQQQQQQEDTQTLKQSKAAQRLEELGPIANLFPTLIDGRQPGLIGLATAGRARRFVQLTQEQQRQQVLGQVAAYFGLSRDAVEARLERFVVHSFAGDEFSQGCFTALMPPGLATAHGRALQAPVGHRLHFAGSETASNCCGYLEGALEAGNRAAREVLDCLHGQGALEGRAAVSRL